MNPSFRTKIGLRKKGRYSAEISFFFSNKSLFPSIPCLCLPLPKDGEDDGFKRKDTNGDVEDSVPRPQTFSAICKDSNQKGHQKAWYGCQHVGYSHQSPREIWGE